MSFFFLMCSERSGSNFITKLMNGHPAVAGPSTKHIVNPVARNLFRYGDLQRDENWRELVTDVHRLLNIDFSEWARGFTLDELADLAQDRSAATLIRGIFAAEAAAAGKEHVFVKENHLYEFFPFLQVHFPAARYVYLVRDPRDMALSWKLNLPTPGGVVSGARQWLKDQTNSLKNYHLLREAGRARLVRYEDLIAEPEARLQELCAFLEIPYDPVMLDFHQDALTRRNAEKIPAWENLSKAVMSGNKQKYRRELSDDEVRAVEKICQVEMRWFGYRCEFSPRELAAVTDQEVRRLEELDLRTIPVERDPGIAANMEAKRVFYHKELEGAGLP